MKNLPKPIWEQSGDCQNTHLYYTLCGIAHLANSDRDRTVSDAHLYGIQCVLETMADLALSAANATEIERLKRTD